MQTRNLRIGAALAAFASTLIAGGLAEAHISVASGVGFANATNEVAFGVGHGCNGHDTYKVVMDVPAGVTGLRTLTSDFGPATVTLDTAGNVKTVTWQKPLANLLPSDTAYYRLSARMKLPDAPYSSIYFKFHQTCRDAAGVEEVVDWVALPTNPAVPDGGVAVEPAAGLRIVPARVPGWNKYTLPAGAQVAAADMPAYFAGALIVWRGTQAYSPNPNVAAVIAITPGVTALNGLAAADVIWVKY